METEFLRGELNGLHVVGGRTVFQLDTREVVVPTSDAPYDLVDGLFVNALVERGSSGGCAAVLAIQTERDARIYYCGPRLSTLTILMSAAAFALGLGLQVGWLQAVSFGLFVVLLQKSDQQRRSVVRVFRGHLAQIPMSAPGRRPAG